MELSKLFKLLNKKKKTESKINLNTGKSVCVRAGVVVSVWAWRVRACGARVCGSAVVWAWVWCVV